MKRTGTKKNKRSVGRVVAGMLVGSVVGATVGLLTAPVSGEETRRKVTGQVMAARDKVKAAAETVENRAREIIAEADRITDPVKKPVTRRTTTVQTDR